MPVGTERHPQPKPDTTDDLQAEVETSREVAGVEA